MKAKTFKGMLKKAGFYALCFSPLAIAIGCFGLAVGGGVVSNNYGNKGRKIRNEIYPKILMTDEFKEYKSDKEEKLVAALQDGIISPYEFTKKNEELTEMYHVLEFAKTLPEFSAQAELAVEYDNKESQWMNSIFALFGCAGAAVVGVFSGSYAVDHGRYINFDNQKDIEKKKNKLQAKQQKLTKKEKEL